MLFSQKRRIIELERTNFMKNLSLILISLLFANPASAQIYAGTRYHAPEMQSQYSNERSAQPIYVAPQYNPPQPNTYNPSQYRQNYVNQLPMQRVCRIINGYLVCN